MQTQGNTPTNSPTLRTLREPTFTIKYPTGWRIVDQNLQKVGYIDNTITEPKHSIVLLRVDVNPPVGNPDTATFRSANAVHAALEREPLGTPRPGHVGPTNQRSYYRPGMFGWADSVDTWREAGILLAQKESRTLKRFLPLLAFGALALPSIAQAAPTGPTHLLMQIAGKPAVYSGCTQGA